VGEVIRVGKDILKALISCHRQNIIHRDIKDDNIFVTGDGVYKLGDFGVSKKLQDRSRAASMRGTPNFIAPEVYLGKEAYDCTVDLYSLGIVLYRLLNKLRGPFLPAFPASYTSEDENAAFEARMLGKTPELPLMAQNALGEAVRKALLPRAQRYNSAQEFLEALEEAERLLPREEWLAPAYDVFLPEGDTEAPGQADPFAADPGDQTIGGPLFDTEEDGQFRVEKNLFMTIGAEQAPQTVQSKPAAPQETVLAQEEEDLAQKG
jgi:serine/threonine protein kinase